MSMFSSSTGLKPGCPRNFPQKSSILFLVDNLTGIKFRQFQCPKCMFFNELTEVADLAESNRFKFSLGNSCTSLSYASFSLFTISTADSIMPATKSWTKLSASEIVTESYVQFVGSEDMVSVS